ncbi:12738_t:CDS:2 [Funneliformis mosseae]|uniref:12738_t:CDS:1 n=1 Tax=Funneliformis mosseae TaxID=27381 RepID=A0A9N9H1B3_FUNMO|nr:12738_t:CDS:2 [Funneliformis mosseae]
MTTTHKHNNKPSQKEKRLSDKLLDERKCIQEEDLLKEKNVAVIKLTLPKLLFWFTAGKEDYPNTAGARRGVSGYCCTRGVSGYCCARGISQVLLGKRSIWVLLDKRTAWILLGKSSARPADDGLEPTAL